jgi:hypothetical protein
MASASEFPPRGRPIPIPSVSRTRPVTGVGLETASRRRALAPDFRPTSGQFLCWLPASLAGRLGADHVTAEELTDILERACEDRLAKPPMTGSQTR